MKKNILIKFATLIFIMLAIPFVAYTSKISQKKEDSLVNQLKLQQDTNRINTLIELTRYYAKIKSDKCENFGLIALEESIELNYKNGISDAHLRLANYYRSVKNYSEAQVHLQEALKNAEKSNSVKNLIISYIGLGNLYLNINRYDQAIKYYEKGANLSKRTSAWNDYSIICNNLGQVYEYKSDFKKAKDYYYQGLSKENPTKKTENYLNLLQNIGSALYYLDQTDSAFFYNNLAKKIFIEQDDFDGLLGTYLNEGVYIEYSGNYEKAIQSYQAALQLVTETTSLSTLQNLNQNIMLCYGYLGNIDSLNHYFALSDKLKQKLIQLKTDKAIHELSIKYDVEKKEQRLILVNQENEKAQLSNKLKQTTIYILLAVIAIIALLVFIFYMLYQEKQKLIQLQVEAKNKEIESLIKDQEISIYSAHIKGVEKERQRIAQDLHDKMGGLLATIKLQFEDKNGLSKKSIENVKLLVNESIKTIRSISHDISDGRVDEMGLIKAIEKLKGSIIDSGKMGFDLFLDNYNDSLEVWKEREIFKVVLELLSNTLKHANANHIVLQINVIDKKIHFTFEDNGNGFEPNKVINGLGMRTISQRIDNLHGFWYIDSKPNHGTTVVIEIPIK